MSVACFGMSEPARPLAAPLFTDDSHCGSQKSQNNLTTVQSPENIYLPCRCQGTRIQGTLRVGCGYTTLANINQFNQNTEFYFHDSQTKEVGYLCRYLPSSVHVSHQASHNVKISCNFNPSGASLLYCTLLVI